MSDEVLGDRRKALEESFFAKENARLLEKLKSEKSAGEAKEALAKISGIESDEMLDKLCALGIDAESWAAVSIAPMVEVAWADGKIDTAERKAVLAAAEANGLQNESSGIALLENWLDARPDKTLMEAWEALVVHLCEELNPTERDALKNQVMGRARDVANATGGFLGLGSKTSAVEEAVLVRLEKAFQS